MNFTKLFLSYGLAPFILTLGSLAIPFLGSGEQSSFAVVAAALFTVASASGFMFVLLKRVSLGQAVGILASSTLLSVALMAICQMVSLNLAGMDAGLMFDDPRYSGNVLFTTNLCWLLLGLCGMVWIGLGIKGKHVKKLITSPVQSAGWLAYIAMGATAFLISIAIQSNWEQAEIFGQYLALCALFYAVAWVVWIVLLGALRMAGPSKANCQ